MARRLKNTLRSALRMFWGVLLFAIISVAVIVQLGRAVFPVLDDYRVLLEQQLSQQMQVDVVLGQIQAKWDGLRPQLHLLNVEVKNRDGTPIFLVHKVDVELSLLATARNWRHGLRKLRFTGLRGTLEQKDGGSWGVRGLQLVQHRPSDEGDEPTLDDPLDVFLFGRRVELLDTSLEFRFRTGLSSHITFPSIRLENDADFHRLTAGVDVDGDDQTLALILEGHGDPRVIDKFDAQGYLVLKAFPSEKVLAALGIASDILVGDDDHAQPHDWQDSGKVDLRLWFSGTSFKGLRWRGDMTVSGVPVIPPAGMIWPEYLRASFAGEWHPESGWYLDLTQAILDWHDFSAPPLKLRLRGNLGEPSQLLTSDLDVGAWYGVVERAGLLPRADEVLKQLAPYGHLHNVVVTRTTAEEGYFDLRANIRDAGVRPWAGVPGIDGVEGYIEANAFAGHVQLARDQGFTLEFPKIYKRPLELQTAFGDVRWHVDRERRMVGVSSGTLRVSNDDIAATGHFNLRLPFASSANQEPELTLVIGARQGAATLHRLLVPYTIPGRLYQWLDDGIQSGLVTNAGFIYHGSVAKDPQLARVIQLSANVDGGRLVFDKKWPALTDASASIVLDDENFRVSHLRGQMMGVNIVNGEVVLEALPKDGGRAIALRGDLQANSGDAITLLQNSPIKKILGEQLASWQMTGDVSGRIDLLVPLQADQGEAHQAIDIHVADNRLHMPALNLTFTKINGSFTYSSRDGLRSEQLVAKLWDQPVKASIDSDWLSQNKSVQLGFSGKVDMRRLQTWSKRPELGFAEGVTTVKGAIQLPIGGDQPRHFRASSTLKGVAIDLPAPMAKGKADLSAMQVDIRSYSPTDERPSHQDYEVEWRNHARLGLQVFDGQVDGVTLAFGPVEPSVNRGRFSVIGQIEEADIPSWNKTLDRYLEFSAEQQALDDAEGPQQRSTLPIHVALDLRKLHFGALSFDHVLVKAERPQDEWIMTAQSPQMAGEFRVLKGQPLVVNLSHLRLPKKAKEAALSTDMVGPPEPPSGLAQVDLSAIDPVDFYCADVQIGERSYGAWQFHLRPIPGGLMAYDLKAKTLGARIRGRTPESKGAELVWLRSGTGDTTYFSGRATMKNAGDLLTQLDQGQVLTSSSARFDLDLQWQGAPDAMALNKLVGFIDLELERGRFIRGADAGENPVVKLLGLLNFDTLTRRLRLDFSDLNPEGLGYERVSGRLAFKAGIIEVNKPLQVDSPASHLQFVGDINLVKQTVDAQLITTLPLTGNLTMAAAVTGLLPAALGVFVVSKLFKEQFDKVSSIRYSINGRWNDPKMEVEKIFENKTDRQRGVQKVAEQN